MTKVPDHIARMIRVDQAGEFGATRIYAGQLAVMGDRGPHSAEIAGMAEQEVGHREKFDALMARRGVRPTALQPFWDRAGFALGAVTALIGPEAAMRQIWTQNGRNLIRNPPSENQSANGQAGTKSTKMDQKWSTCCC